MAARRKKAFLSFFFYPLLASGNVSLWKCRRRGVPKKKGLQKWKKEKEPGIEKSAIYSCGWALMFRP